MTPGVVASKAMLYQEVDRGPGMPRARFGEAPLHLRRRCVVVWLRSSYGSWTQYGPEGEGD
jgi:hypothetical protein